MTDKEDFEDKPGRENMTFTVSYGPRSETGAERKSE